ncbi:hypothetical protein ACOSP7_005064 [Xanthoceras sorbifolium]|uniref:Uncharacterized protein n=1 Tax=Xanthoceras sorbifolium TaxID=99658 RepID=A0ABQ8IFG2_9ROSI|nr:hypothetical protein JRO89_XS02G0095800 [Xanthoceras sorbifolium]
MARFWFLMSVAHAVFMFLSVAGSSDPDKFSPISEDNVTATISIRELTERSNTQRNINKDRMNLDDYSPVDPVPSSSATVTSGPIEHGTPLLPNIPKLTPPYRPWNVGSPLPTPPA